MSSALERRNFGTTLVAGLEEVLIVNEVDVVVLYPAENGRAGPFWASIGFETRDPSCLPQEELVQYPEGPLLPEFSGGNKQLPRWEKRLTAQRASGAPPKNTSDLDHENVRIATQELLKMRAALKKKNRKTSQAQPEMDRRRMIIRRGMQKPKTKIGQPPKEQEKDNNAERMRMRRSQNRK